MRFDRNFWLDLCLLLIFSYSRLPIILTTGGTGNQKTNFPKSFHTIIFGFPLFDVLPKIVNTIQGHVVTDAIDSSFFFSWIICSKHSSIISLSKLSKSYKFAICSECKKMTKYVSSLTKTSPADSKHLHNQLKTFKYNWISKHERKVMCI